MKVIIFSFLVIFLATTSRAEIVSESLCRLLPKSQFDTASGAAIKCAVNAPAFTLFKKFEKNFPDISFERTEAAPGDGVWTQFGVKGYAYYVSKAKDGKIEFMQGLPKSECHYKYNVVVGNDQKTKFCQAEAPKNTHCVSKWANDPIRNPRKKERSCNVFLDAMVSCMDETKNCKQSLYAHMNESEKPIPNPNNVPRPSTEAGIGDGVK